MTRVRYRYGDRSVPALPRRSVLALCLAALACHTTHGPRCATCGMAVRPGSHWTAGAVGPGGTVLAFDTPGCLLRYARRGGQALRDPWVTEYYTAVRTDARVVLYAEGSAVTGPMGEDLVPIAPERAATFATDHHPRRVLSWSTLTAPGWH